MRRIALFSAGLGLVSALVPALSGCVPLAVGAAAVGGAGVASQERGVSGFVDDAGIQLTINDVWLKHSTGLHSRIGLTIDQGRVMLTGRAANAQERLDAVRLTWTVNGVREVINEITIGPEPSISDTARDRWISTRFRAAITVESDVSSQNYAFTTSERVIYLLGTAKSRAELDRVIDIARRTPSVERVVDHVVLRGG